LVTGRHVESANPDVEYWETAVHTLEIDIAGTLSRIQFFVNPSAHFDLSYVFGIELAVGDTPPINLSERQCLTSLVDRCLLVHEFFQGHFGVTDLRTGETLIGNLSAAMWLD
jgi:hypothetical protein